MSVSKAQLARVIVTCKCGCGEAFSAFPVYKKGGGGLRVPEYQRGHHPNCRKAQFPNEPWNKGLRKKTTPIVGRQGKHGVEHWNYDPEQNPDFFAPDFDYVYYSRKFGLRPRSKGGSKLYTKFRLAIMRRDKFTCVDCGLVADETEETDLLNVHHIEFVKHNKDRIFDPTNVVTVCYTCHRKRHRSK